MYIYQQIDERLQRERADRIYREYAAEDDGSFDRAINELEREEARKRENAAILVHIGSGEKSERSYKGIKI